jgi:hypothetical protein
VLNIERQLENLGDLTAEDRVDVICDIFESSWHADKRQDLRAYLVYCAPGERANLAVELVLVDRDLRIRKGEPVSWEEYVKAFPEYADKLEAARFQLQSEGIPELLGDESTFNPQQMSHFELLERLGSGSAAIVWKARDTRLQRIVALKVPHTEYLSEEGLGQFLQEGRTAAKLHHPGIVAVHEVGRSGKAAYIVSDFVAGQDLRKWLTRTKPTPRQAAELCEQIANALEHAHQQGIIHRDLKPANVLLDANGKTHITDFGLAKHISADLTLSGSSSVLGTPAYMPPEQARGNSRNVDTRSDVYSLGVLLYEMLTGERPFEGDHESVLRSVLTQQPARPRQLNLSIPLDLELICIKAMEKDPAARYQTAVELRDDLHRFLNGMPIKARRYRIAELAWRAVRRRLAASLVVLIALFVLGGSAWVWWSAPQTAGRSDSPRAIRLETTPRGAKVLFVPISPYDGEPDPKRAIKAPGVSPIEMKLSPGNYWVEAVMPDGRFHEALRYVDKWGEWDSSNSVAGKIRLKRIEIPNLDINSNMIYVPRSENCEAFFVESRVATVNDINRLDRGSHEYVGYSSALNFGEDNGKRLPTNNEWQQAQSVLAARTAGDVAEWTSTLELIPDNKSDLVLNSLRYRECRIVRGGSLNLLEGKSDLSPRDYSEGNSLPIPIDAMYRGIGVRLVRSAEPRFWSLINASK